MITALLLVSRILESIPHDIYTVPDLDLEIRRGGGGSPKKHFLALWASVWSKNKGAAPRAPPLGPPLLHTNSPDCSPYISLRN